MIYKEEPNCAESFDLQLAEKQVMKNPFKIFNEDGIILASGHNVVLNIGRRVNAAKLLGTPLVLTAVENSSGVPVTVTDCSKFAFAGFSLQGGIIPAALGTLPIPPVVSTTDIPFFGDSLSFNGALASDDVAGQYDASGTIKLHVVAGTNPTTVLDTSVPAMAYSKNELVVAQDEMLEHYFNKVITWVKIDIGTGFIYAPYSAFSFAPLHNQNGLYTTTIEYGIYF